MAKISPLMLLPPVIFAGFAIFAYVGMFRDDPNALESTRVGKPAPAISAPALPGFNAVPEDVFTTGEVTLVNFWASWCPPCRAEHPKLLDMQSEGMRIIGVNFRDQEGTATQYLTDDGNPFLAVPFDPNGRTAIDWGVTAPPETFIVDGDGIVRYRFAGPLVGSDFENRFLPELEKALN